jgi:hypothetical protein
VVGDWGYPYYGGLAHPPDAPATEGEDQAGDVDDEEDDDDDEGGSGYYDPIRYAIQVVFSDDEPEFG